MPLERRWRLQSQIGSHLRSKGLGPGRPVGSAAARRYRTYEPHNKIALVLELDDCPWRAVYEIEAVDGRPAIKAIRLEPSSDPLTPSVSPTNLPARTDLRTLIVPAMALAEARSALSTLGAERRQMHGLADINNHRPTRQQSRYFYARIAERYAELCAQGSTSPNKDVLAWLETETGGSYPPWYVRDKIDTAREREWLTPAPGPRRAGGKLTDLGRQVIAEGSPAGYTGPEIAP